MTVKPPKPSPILPPALEPEPDEGDDFEPLGPDEDPPDEAPLVVPTGDS